MRHLSALVFATLLAAPFVATFTTLADAPESCRPGDVFENEDVRIWFHGSKGFVKVFDNNGSDDQQGHFDYKTGELVEVTADGAELARMNLERAFPQTSGCTIEETEEWINMTLTVTDDVKSAGGAAAQRGADAAADASSVVGQATVEFAYNFNKTSNGAKFDLNVYGWPWQGDDGELNYAFDVHAAGGTLTPAENGIGYTDENGEQSGFIEWAANATANYEDGHNETSVVDANTTMDGSQNARVVLRFTNVTAGYDELLYDPWVGGGLWIAVGPILVPVARLEDIVLQALGALL